MCGLTGFFGIPSSGSADNAIQLLRKMTDAIAHRGPDSDGHWLDVNEGIALGHRRLAIIDLSPAGAQPMLSASGRYVIVYNGEIYNHLALRAELQNNGLTTTWRGHSDTEVLLAGFDVWGIQATVERAAGMFAFAAWDRQTRTLTLGRDRLGEKPLYYGWQGSGESAVFMFGSELKALRVHPAFKGRINRDALCLYMRLNNIGGEHCIYEGIRKLLPGTLLTVSKQLPEPSIAVYWSAAGIAQAGVAQPFIGSAEEAVDGLELLLADAVRRQMMADVPLGAFLSGGVDSSVVVALMQTQASRPVETFSIGFHEDAYNEAVYAKAVAQHLGTKHTELHVTPAQALAVISRLPSIYDEPFADSSQIPTFLLSQMTRQHVAVSLSGDGGDELFGGYNRYALTASLWRKLAAVPLPLRRMLAWGVTQISPEGWNRLVSHTPVTKRWTSVGYKLHKGASVMAARSTAELYQSMVSQWVDPESLVLGGAEPVNQLTGGGPALSGLNDVERMMALDMLTYLPNDILTKVDRAAMAVSLETRVPFLDHRVVEFAWKLPLHYKLRREGRGYTTKWALRQVLYRHVPQAMIERPKMGFGIPLDSWLRGPLREWAEDLISEPRLRREAYLDPVPIRQKWDEHLSGRRNWQHPLWNVLMFQAWLAANSA